MIKSELHLNSVLALMRSAQKEAGRFPSKYRVATARYWEGIVDQYLESAERENCRTVIRLKGGPNDHAGKGSGILQG